MLLNLSQPPPPLSVVSAAGFAPGPLAPGSIASAFGEKLAPGATVSVQDSAGTSRVAPLFFASSSQINFLVPAETAIGPATIAVSGGLTAKVQIAAVAPALFSAGSGVAAGYAVQVAPGGSQTGMPDLAAPIDVSQPGQVFLTLFGTGFGAAGAGSTTATVQGVSVPVTYAGPQGAFTGLDQVNLLLPSSLAGTGSARISVSIGGVISNTVYITIR